MIEEKRSLNHGSIELFNWLHKNNIIDGIDIQWPMLWSSDLLADSSNIIPGHQHKTTCMCTKPEISIIYISI